MQQVYGRYCKIAPTPDRLGVRERVPNGACAVGSES